MCEMRTPSLYIRSIDISSLNRVCSERSDALKLRWLGLNFRECSPDSHMFHNNLFTVSSVSYAYEHRSKEDISVTDEFGK